MGCLVMPEHSRQALPKEKEEAGCADKQPDPTHYVSDETQSANPESCRRNRYDL